MHRLFAWVAPAAMSATLVGAPNVTFASPSPTAATSQPELLPANPERTSTTGARTTQSPGTVLDVDPLDPDLWIPGTTRAAYRITHATTDAHDAPATSTGVLFIPFGTPPKSGWPVVSWAHGTVGLSDECAPSVRGRSQRDNDYLATWMREGYAVVASDYVGLGTPGPHPYLGGRPEAHSIIDMVKAGRSVARRLPGNTRLSREWVVVGQSQGAGAAIFTARYATDFGGPTLDYRGAVGTGAPPYVERDIEPIGPTYPTEPVGGTVSAYVAYIFAALRAVHRDLGIDTILTDTGRDALALADDLCLKDLAGQLEESVISDWFSEPVNALPGWKPTVDDYMAFPEEGFDQPLFLAHGLYDVDAPYENTASYAAQLRSNGEPVTFTSYPTDHSGTMSASLPDTLPFVQGLFAN